MLGGEPILQIVYFSGQFAQTPFQAGNPRTLFAKGLDPGALPDERFVQRQADAFVFMDNQSYEQYELSREQVDDAWKYLKEGMVCSMLLFNNNPIGMTPPNHVVLKVEYCEPGAKGNTATNVTKPVKVETDAEIQCPSFVEIGDVIRVDTRTGAYVERVRE